MKHPPPTLPLGKIALAMSVVVACGGGDSVSIGLDRAYVETDPAGEGSGGAVGTDGDAGQDASVENSTGLALDLGSGTAGLKTNEDGSVSVWSHQVVGTTNPSPTIDYANKTTAVFHTTFREVSTTTTSSGDLVLFSAPDPGFFELWYEDGSGQENHGWNAASCSDGVLILSAHFDGTGAGTMLQTLGSVANLGLSVDSFDPAYFDRQPATLSLYSGLFDNPRSAVAVFVPSPGASPIAIDVDRLDGFPDGGLAIRFLVE